MSTHVVITGCGSGLGRELATALCAMDGFIVTGIDKDLFIEHPVHTFIQCDLTDPVAVERTCDLIPYCDILINCAGINGINWLKDLELGMWDDVMNVNARAIFLMSKFLLGKLRTGPGTIVNIVSNASHMPMTNSLAYNASKGAAHIMTLQLARELSKTYGITVFGVSPNKMAGTRMSRYIDGAVPAMRGWSQQQADAYQKAGLLAGEETDPRVVAEFIAFLLQDKQHHKYLTGCIIPYGA